MSRHEERAARRATRAQARRDPNAPAAEQSTSQPSTKGEKEKLPPHWEAVQTAIWLIGLAILFWRGWIFPGILILVAISGLTQAAMMAYVNRQKEAEAVTAVRELYLPDNCPSCGGPVTPTTVRWTGRTTAACPYCGSSIKARETPLVKKEA